MPKKILVVDDEKHIVMMMESRLGAFGFEVITAICGIECLEKVKNEKPDLVILDVFMPEMDGLEVLDALKTSEETKSIQVIMLTANAQAEDIKKALGAGAAGYIIKPFDPQLLHEEINKVFDRNES